MKDITSASSVLYGTGSRRYEPGAQWFHWITAALVFTIIPLGWIFAEFKTKGNPPTSFEAPFPGAPGDYATAHKSIGIIIFALIIARFAFRLLNPPPALPGSMGGLTRLVSNASHWLLYLVLFCMPISGYIASSGGKHPISFLGLFDLPKLPVSHDIGEQAAGRHVLAQWILLGLIALHLAGTAWHLFVRRDAILDRMLPRQANAE
jgi:cytochrome b561